MRPFSRIPLRRSGWLFTSGAPRVFHMGGAYLSFSLVAFILLAPAALNAQGTREDYARAERFLPQDLDGLVLNEGVEPNWLDDSDRFWYRRELVEGKEFLLVDASAGTREPAFDHGALAAALAGILGGEVQATDLPFDRFEFSEDASAIHFRADTLRLRCTLAEYDCAPDPAEDADPAPGTSPDGRWVAFVEDYDLYLRSIETGWEKRLTHDGTRDHAYATRLPSPTLMVRQQTEEPEQPPTVFWSPDSKRLLTYRIDAREVGRLSMVQHAPEDRVRPRFYTYAYPLPVDSVLPVAEPILFEMGSWIRTDVQMEPLVMQYYGGPYLGWSEDGRRARVVTTDRGYTRREVVEIDGLTGETRVMIREEMEPYVDLYAGAPLEYLEDGARVLWGSERDGWMHLYLYDGSSGRLERQLTRGEWVVRGVEYLDEDSGVVFFTAGGKETDRDPYLRHLYRVGLGGGEPRLLTPEEGDHLVSFSPTGDFFVDVHSLPTRAPTSVLRRSNDGRVVMELEEADIRGLLETGWEHPEPFRAVAEDGTTEIFGVIWRPTNFDSSRRYPVVEQIYTGPHNFFVPKSFRAYRNTAQSIAELGFVVIQVDGRGTGKRSRTFHDFSYKNLGGVYGDHVAAIRQLGERYDYLNVDQVGIYGHSAGGYDATHAILTHPDFYDVAVSSAGNHDNRMDKAVWNTQWMGWPIEDVYREQSNVTLAPNLQGKLLLAHGDVDENVPVSATLQLAGALIEANKDFDLIIMPNQTHGMGRHPYFIRKRWDFFVEHLLGVEPPTGYEIGADRTGG